MSSYEKIALALSGIIATIGLFYGLETSGVNFSRSGALIVVVGIIYGLFDLPKRLSNISNWAKEQALKNKSNLIKEIEDYGKSHNQAEEIYEKVINETIEEVNAQAKKARKRLILIEGVILVSGTLIWSFGDLINVACNHTS